MARRSRRRRPSRPRVLSTVERGDLLGKRIPDRLFELYLCTHLIDMLEADQDLPIVLRRGADECEISSARVLLQSSLDAAILMCRALLHFLGIKHDGRGLRTEPPTEQTDICIEHLGPSLVTVAQATNNGDVAIRDALLLVLRTANKGVGHLTFKPAREIARDLQAVKLACTRTMELIDQYLYNLVPESAPGFRNGGYGWVRVQPNSSNPAKP